MHSGTVFVVDDEDAIRRSLASLFEASGFETVTCDSAAEFLEKYSNDSPGCVILDVRMPGMDGLELQSYLIQHKIFLPVIVLTGHGDVPMAVKAMIGGAFYFMQKPADIDLLVDKVTEAVELNAQQQMHSSECGEIRENLAKLTDRESQVLAQLVQGKPTSSIASALGIRDSTIRVQRAAILRKMQADSVVDLLRMTALLNR